MEPIENQKIWPNDRSEKRSRVVSEYRAILVSREQCEWLSALVKVARSQADWLSEKADALARQTLEAFDAAGDQPRTRWCLPHGRVATVSGSLCPKTSGTNPCRVVDAIVVPLPEQP